jgi:anti-sigma factor RsiW
MNEQHEPISEEDIHAYVDGALAEHRRAEVERLLETDDALARRVSDYFALGNLLHERYDRVLSEPVPQRLLPPDPAAPVAAVARKRWFAAANWPQFAGLAAALVVGIGIGVGGMTSQPAREMLMSATGDSQTRRVSASASKEESFARQSAIAYVTYAPMVTRPVEVGADQEQELVRWLSSRLGTDVHAPILTRVGYNLMGGRLLPGEDGPVAQFMYHDANGERITLNVSHRKPKSDVTAFKLYEDGSVKVFYWVDGDFGYAVSGAIDRKVLLDVSHDVYEQLTESGSGRSAD